MGARAFKQKLGAVLNASVRHCCPVGKANAKARLGMQRLLKADVGSLSVHTPRRIRVCAFISMRIAGVEARSHVRVIMMGARVVGRGPSADRTGFEHSIWRGGRRQVGMS